VQVREADLKELLGRAYVYWTPHPWLALSPEYQFERFKRVAEFIGPEEILRVDTHRLSFGINFFHPLGFRARLKPSYVNQEGEFGFKGGFGRVRPGDDQFWLVDASIGYCLPKRWGLLTLEGRNLFNQEFKFQDTNPAQPAIHPEQLILARFTLAF
jgi:TonB dependent receptor